MRLGRLEVIAGPMFAGKTEELIKRLHRAKIAKRKVLLVKTRIDDRYADNAVVSHNGVKMEACACELDELRNIVDDDVDVIGIDEVQFYNADIFNVIMDWIDEGRVVIVSGLDMTYRQEPFGIVPNLMACAEKVDKYTAICHRCGNEAYFTQRLVDDKPASFSGDTVVVGGLDSYEARCRNCFEYAP